MTQRVDNMTCSGMEGNWDLVRYSVAEKPIVGNWGTYKRTFPLDHATGRVLIRGASSADEELLERSSGNYAGMGLLRGLWEEPTARRGGTFFPLAAPEGRVLWGGAGHCLLPAEQHGWRCGFGTDVSPQFRPVGRAVVGPPDESFGFMLTETFRPRASDAAVHSQR